MRAPSGVLAMTVHATCALIGTLDLLTVDW